MANARENDTFKYQHVVNDINERSMRCTREITKLSEPIRIRDLRQTSNETSNGDTSNKSQFAKPNTVCLSVNNI